MRTCCMKALRTCFWGLLAFQSLIAHGQTSDSVTPPEVKKTVDALRGRWVLTGTDTEPGSKATPLTAQYLHARTDWNHRHSEVTIAFSSLGD